MNASIQLALGINPVHRNQYLFSDHYLHHLLADDPRWSAALAESETFLAWLQTLHVQEKAQLPRYTEAQLEDHWFQPILAQLGHVFEVQASVPGLNQGVKYHDYVFFPDEDARQGAVGAQKTEGYYSACRIRPELKLRAKSQRTLKRPNTQPTLVGFSYQPGVFP